MSWRRARWAWMPYLAVLLGTAAVAASTEAAEGGWRAVQPAELAMTSEPNAPGAAAIYLYTQVDRSDIARNERTYRQIKILAEEGRNRASIEIAYNRQGEVITGVEARVIQQDGTVVPFSGTVYDRPLVANREVSWYAKSFALEDVRVGSVIEYRFERQYTALYNSRWVLSQDLFTRLARYSLRKSPDAALRWSWPVGMPEGTAQPRLDRDSVTMEIANVPAFVMEDYMPPPDDLLLSVNFSYVLESRPTSDPVEFWRDFGKARWKLFESFIGKPKAVQEQLAKIVSAGDSPAEQIRKIYEQVRGMRNRDDPEASGQQATGRCDRVPLSAREVGKYGCGRPGELQMYFIALVRAAGLPAVPVLTAPRSERFFTPQSMLTAGLTSWIVAVTIDGKDVFLAPGIPSLPFGALLWTETAVPGLRLDREGGQWITTPMPVPQDASVRRRARLSLSEDGVLEGTVTVLHSGHEAVVRLMALRDADDKTRREVLEEDLRRAIAVPAEIAVVRQPDWRARDGVIETEYHVTIDQWAVISGNRILLGVGLFGAEQKGKFIAPVRQHPIYFGYPYQTEDLVEIHAPDGYRMQGVPAPMATSGNALVYRSSVVQLEGMISIQRTVVQNALLANATAYPMFRAFYEAIRSGDQEQVVLVR